MTAKTVLAPADVPPAIGAYVHGILVPPGASVVHTAGQVGIRLDGTVPETVGEQAEQAFRNVLGVVKAAGMGVEDIVKATLFVVAGQDLDAVRAARARVFGDAKPASTLLIISGLATPNLLFEVEAIAAKVL
ncbi:RidA family protein [Zavarzinia sp. CC-PAN008]|uniref:RidA family protein n=1 Tax=Zavarzinia sp. CC-PAN008 TaxID=3243332 RepID=UPI003F745DCB